jgi:phosphopantothenoylcysteine decarboxylase/phosphopantothenate--cysteine ligase
VVLVTGPVALPPPAGAVVVPVVSAAEMAIAAKRAFRTADAAIFTAAVCDYRPAQQTSRKLKKSSRPVAVRLEPTEDIAASLGRIKGRRITIGFALEDHEHRRFAEEKLARKRCDAIVLNSPGNVGRARAEIELLVPGEGWSEPYAGTKPQVAAKIIRLAERLHRKGRR